MSQYKAGHTYNVGEKIDGIYRGQAYSGVIKISRRHSMRNDLTELFIELSKPLTIYGTVRKSINVSILDNGNEL